MESQVSVMVSEKQYEQGFIVEVQKDVDLKLLQQFTSESPVNAGCTGLQEFRLCSQKICVEAQANAVAVENPYEQGLFL